MKIIDFHIHYMPEIVPSARILNRMDALGIEKSVVLATPDHPRYTELGLTGTNERVLELWHAHPTRFIPACYIEPRNIMEAQTHIRRFYDNGVRFLKMWPGHGFSPDDKMICPVFELINELKMGVIFHMGMMGFRLNLDLAIRRSTGFNAKFGQPILLDAPARVFPDIKFVMAHTAWPWTLEAVAMAQYPNIYIDFSCPSGYDGWNIIDKIRPSRIPWERFLFASDTAGQADSFVKNWSKIAKENEFFALHAEDFFHGAAERLFTECGLK